MKKNTFLLAVLFLSFSVVNAEELTQIQTNNAIQEVVLNQELKSE
jgi:hypothetical protein